ncbi:hypothetical protein LY39_01689 [Roseinatronobacter bogoriensis subsp. barguzinensis]|nr:hypothetical protein LY39_01689 [Rhodobaca barguzinensis]
MSNRVQFCIVPASALTYPLMNQGRHFPIWAMPAAVKTTEV